MRLALAGDTMLGRGVAERLASSSPESLVAPEVVAAAREADLFVLNLECCISERGRPWPDPRKPFFFRAPPVAVETLVHLGVDCVTLANNHALDFGAEALLDTLELLAAAGIAAVGAGASEDEARRPALLEAIGFRLAVVGLSDHPEAFAARPERPGIAFADLRRGQVPGWLARAVAGLADRADAVLVTPHWGPNMTERPAPQLRAAGRAFLDAGATLVAGHSAHVFHGIEVAQRAETRGGPTLVLYDLGDFVDDYAVDPRLRNDLGLLFLVDLDRGRANRIEALPLKLEYCHTRLADGEDLHWIRRRFRAACAELGTEAQEEGDRLVVATG